MFILRKTCDTVRRNLTYVHKMSAEVDFLFTSKLIVPPLTNDKRKGQAGRIGIVGGSKEYTGAPYFSAISALKVGADLVHVFCTLDSSSVIKSYSPELIVHPLLNDEDALEKMKPWLERLDVLVIGPGLGRDEKIMSIVTDLLNFCRHMNTPVVIDADGLFLVTNNRNVIKNYPNAILTPNAVEFSRLFGVDINSNLDPDEARKLVKELGDNIVIVKKGPKDAIFDYKNSVECTTKGSARRCGGQGDLLSGSLGTFYAWALKSQENIDDADHPNARSMIACYAACRLTRECNARAFISKGRSMTCVDMIEKIHETFEELYELPLNG